MGQIFIILTDDHIFHEVPSWECKFTEDGLCVNTLEEFPYDEIAVIGKYGYDDKIGKTTERLWERDDYGG